MAAASPTAKAALERLEILRHGYDGNATQELQICDIGSRQ
jgi:hypothetical protein